MYTTSCHLHQKRVTFRLSMLFTFGYFCLAGILLREWYLNDFFLPMSMVVFLASIPVGVFFAFKNYFKGRYYRVYLYNILPVIVGAISTKVFFYWVDMIAVYCLVK